MESSPDQTFFLASVECQDLDDDDGDDEATVRLWGVMEDGQSICLLLEGFQPYFYVEVPLDWSHDDVDTYMKSVQSKHEVASWSIIQREQLYGFTNGKQFPFIEIYFNSIKGMRNAGRMMSRGVNIRGESEPIVLKIAEFERTHPVLKFLHLNNDMIPIGWYRVLAGTYQRPPNKTNCKHTLATHYRNVMPVDRKDFPPLMLASIDAEMNSVNGQFPKADRRYDFVGQIVVHTFRLNASEQKVATLFCLGTIDDSENKLFHAIYRFSSERKMLMAFRDWIVNEVDPDILIGHNLVEFDLRYFLNRSGALGIQEDFSILGRIPYVQTKLVLRHIPKDAGDGKKKRKNNKYISPYKPLVISGRTVWDTRLLTQSNGMIKLRSYSLSSVSQHFLDGFDKLDVSPHEIFESFEDTSDYLRAPQQLEGIQKFHQDLLGLVWFRSQVEDVAYAKAVMSLKTVSQSLIDAMLPSKQSITLEQIDARLKQYQETHTKGDAIVNGNFMLPLPGKSSEPVVPLGHMAEDADDEDVEFPIPDAAVCRKRELEGPSGKSETVKKTVEAQGDVMDSDLRAEPAKHPWLDQWLALLELELRVWQVVKEHKVRAKRIRPILQNDCMLPDTIANLHREQVLKRTTVAKYCNRDVELVDRLFYKLQIFLNVMSMCQVTGVPSELLMNSGQTIKVFNLITRWARRNNVICTSRVLSLVLPFVGGHVEDPCVGYYDKPVLTFDFSSLYPSIIITAVLCYMTLVLPEDVARILALADTLVFDEIDDVAKHKNHPGLVLLRKYVPTNGGEVAVYWVQNRKSCLPQILEMLLNERDAVKRQMKSEQDPFNKTILDGRQLALKLVANSTYGFTGFGGSNWPCLPIAVCTTLIGRNSILFTKMVVERTYEGCKVIYGDTDSVFVVLKMPLDIATESQMLDYAFEVGHPMARMITSKFTGRMNIIFEKAFLPFVSVAPKRYFGMKYEARTKKSIAMSGVEAARRDNCLLLAETMTKTVELIVTDMVNGKVKAVEYVKSVFQKLIEKKVPVEKLVISNNLGAEYASEDLIHVHLNNRLQKEDPLYALEVGDRVQYVVVKVKNETIKTKKFLKGEHPKRLEKVGSEIDWPFYFFRQIKKPMDRVLCRVFGYKYDDKHDKQPTDFMFAPEIKKMKEIESTTNARLQGNSFISSYFSVVK